MEHDLISIRIDKDVTEFLDMNQFSGHLITLGTSSFTLKMKTNYTHLNLYQDKELNWISPPWIYSEKMSRLGFIFKSLAFLTPAQTPIKTY